MSKFLRVITLILLTILSLSVFATPTNSAINVNETNIANLLSIGNEQQSNSPTEKKLLLTTTQQQNIVNVNFEIPNGLMLFQNRINISADKNPLSSKDFKLPATIKKNESEPVYTNKLNFDVFIPSTTQKLYIQYQYCSNAICYLPILKEVTIKPITKHTITFTQWLSTLTFLGIGILLAFTPCVLPMLPIVSSFVIGNSSKLKSFLLVSSYILGVAFVYVIIGILISKVGIAFQIYMQQKIFIIPFMILFIILALSLFGLFNLQLPSFATNKIHLFQSNIKQGSYLGSFIMGGLSSLILSPCTSAPLIGVLTTISQTGNELYGAVSLFLLALGMGIPMLFFALGLKHLVPKSGMWMHEIKVLFGFLMVAMAIYLGSRIFSDTITILLYATVTLIYTVYLFHKSTFSTKLSSVLRYIFSIALCLSLSISTVTYIYLSHHTDIGNIQETNNSKNLDTLIAQSLENHKYILLDFYAKWCTECQKLSDSVLNQESFKDFLNINHINLIKVNLTNYDENSIEISSNYNIQGLPSLVLFDKDKKEVLRTSGLISKENLEHKITKYL